MTVGVKEFKNGDLYDKKKFAKKLTIRKYIWQHLISSTIIQQWNLNKSANICFGYCNKLLTTSITFVYTLNESHHKSNPSSNILAPRHDQTMLLRRQNLFLIPMLEDAIRVTMAL